MCWLAVCTSCWVAGCRSISLLSLATTFDHQVQSFNPTDHYEGNLASCNLFSVSASVRDISTHTLRAVHITRGHVHSVNGVIAFDKFDYRLYADDTQLSPLSQSTVAHEKWVVWTKPRPSQGWFVIPVSRLDIIFLCTKFDSSSFSYSWGMDAAQKI